MTRDRNAYLRNLIVAYSDSIRLSDIKANIAVLFVAIMMGTALQFRDLYPRYLSTPVILTPFIAIFISLLMSVYPRFPRDGRERFPIWRSARPDDFDFIANAQDEFNALPIRCAVLSRILWWKTITLQVAYTLSTICMAVAAALLIVSRL